MITDSCVFFGVLSVDWSARHWLRVGESTLGASWRVELAGFRTLAAERGWELAHGVGGGR